MMVVLVMSVLGSYLKINYVSFEVVFIIRYDDEKSEREWA